MCNVVHRWIQCSLRSHEPMNFYMFVTSELMKWLEVKIWDTEKERETMDVSTQTHSNTKKKSLTVHISLIIVKSMECIGWYISWDGVKNLLCARHFSCKPPKSYEVGSHLSLGSQSWPLDEGRERRGGRVRFPGEVSTWAGDPRGIWGYKICPLLR